MLWFSLLQKLDPSSCVYLSLFVILFYTKETGEIGIDRDSMLFFTSHHLSIFYTNLRDNMLFGTSPHLSIFYNVL